MTRLAIQWLSLCSLLCMAIGCGDEVDPLEQAEQALGKTSNSVSSDASDDPAQKNDDETSSDSTDSAANGSNPQRGTGPLTLQSRKKRKVRQAIVRDEIKGRWLVRLMHITENPNPQQGQNPAQFGERPVMLISVTPGDGKDDKGSIQLIASREEFRDARIANAVATKTSIEFECVDSDGKRIANYRGTLVDSGVVLGVTFIQGNANPTRLLPTTEQTFARIPIFALLDEQSQMMRLSNSPVPEQDLLQFAKDYPDSPLPRMAFRFIIENFAATKRSKKSLNRLVEAYIKTQSRWGKGLEKLAHIEALQWISRAQYDPKYCLEMLDEVQPMLDGSEGIDSLPKTLKDLRKHLNYLLAMTQIKSDEEADKETGRQAIRKLLGESPFDPLLVVALADDARTNGRPQEAIELYAQLAVLPLQEQFLREQWSKEPVRKTLPSERIAKLWKDNETGFKNIDEYLTKVYADKLYAFAEKPIEAREGDGNKVVLCESFTSSYSPYTIASSVALGGLKHTYDDSMVVVLRYYQQHHTSIDALANEEAEVRCYNYYRINGAPGLFVDGVEQTEIAGPLVVAPQVYRSLQEIVDEKLKEKTDVAIALSADRSGDEIKVSAKVTGYDPANKALRLRICLAESGIEYKAFTEIREHNMVVRKLIGGDLGIAATETGFGHDESVSVKAVKNELSAYLKRFEENYDKKANAKPLDLENLYVVAFVQDDASKEVVQTVVVPVKTAQ